MTRVHKPWTTRVTTKGPNYRNEHMWQKTQKWLIRNMGSSVVHQPHASMVQDGRSSAIRHKNLHTVEITLSFCYSVVFREVPALSSTVSTQTKLHPIKTQWYQSSAVPHERSQTFDTWLRPQLPSPDMLTFITLRVLAQVCASMCLCVSGAGVHERNWDKCKKVISVSCKFLMRKD